MKKAFALLLLVLAFSGCDSFLADAQSMDTDGNQKLSAREISTGLIDLADTDYEEGTLREDELQKAFADIGLLKAWDRDKNGRVNATDFVFLFPQAVGDVDNRFSNWDNDGDGTLTNAELSSTLFNKFDLDHNEQLDQGEMEEIFVYYGGIEAYDQDDDGELSFVELEALAVKNL